jgi:hypothetical protein
VILLPRIRHRLCSFRQGRVRFKGHCQKSGEAVPAPQTPARQIGGCAGQDLPQGGAFIPGQRGTGLATPLEIGDLVLADAALIDDAHAVGKHRGFVDIMRHPHRRKAGFQPERFDQALHVEPDQPIQRP